MFTCSDPSEWIMNRLDLDDKLLVTNKFRSDVLVQGNIHPKTWRAVAPEDPGLLTLIAYPLDWEAFRTRYSWSTWIINRAGYMLHSSDQREKKESEPKNYGFGGASILCQRFRPVWSTPTLCVHKVFHGNSQINK